MNKESCPACGSVQLTNFFEIENLPANIGVLPESRDEARGAPRGDVCLAYCHGCGFVFNRIYVPGKVVFEPGYEAYLVHSAVFRAFLESVADRLIEAGVRGILNFAPLRLEVQDRVSVVSVDLSLSLEQLAFQVSLGLTGSLDEYRE